MEDSVTVTDMLSMFDEAVETSAPARRLSERDRDYYDGKQWTPEEVQKLKRRGQPANTYNAIQRKVDYLSGLERQTRRDPKAFPREPGDNGGAQAATDALRYVCDDQDWDQVRSAGWDNLTVEGECAVFVGAQTVRQGVDPMLTHIRWDRFFSDPHSAKADFTDASYLGFVTWDDLESAKLKFPGREQYLTSTLADVSTADTLDDKPKWHLWGDPKRRRVRYAEIYYLRGGQWMRCIFTKAGFLVDPEPSPYLDADGVPECPIKAVSLRKDRDNNSYGEVRIMIGPQDDLNKRMSKALHTINMRQSRVSPGASQTPERIRAELAKPDGVVVAEKDDFEVLLTGDMAAGNLNMMQIAKSFIDGLGANAALAGKNEQDMSGKAILAQQQGGMIELARAMDRLRVLSLAVYRSIWARIRQFWTAERWIRVTSDERNLRFVGLNQPVTVAQLAQQAMEGDKDALATAAKIIPPEIIQAAQQGDEQARLQIALFVRANGDQVVEIRNQVSELDVDIVIDEGMDTPTIEAEQFDVLSKILPSLVNVPPQYAKMLIMASSLRDKDKILDELDASMAGPQIPPELQAQIEQGMQLIQQQGQQIAELQAALGDKTAENDIRQQETDIKAYDAVSARMQALQPEPSAEAA